MALRDFLRRPGLCNLAALTVIQASNALVPLLIVPFALATIGASAYAQVVITEAISAFVLAAVLFSFEIDGVARIAGLGVSAPRAAIGAVFGEILVARLLLFAFVAPLALLLYALAGGQDMELLTLWLLVPLGQVFHAYWFYQATEHNVPPATITLLSRVATLAIVFGMVRGPDDAALIPLAIGGPFALAGIGSTLYVLLWLRIPVGPIRPMAILDGLRRGKEVFAGNVAVSLYREMNVVILGVIGVPAASISTYALVEKSIKMLQAVTRPLNQFFFPKVLRALAGLTGPSRPAVRIVLRYTLPQVAAVLALIVAAPLVYIIAATLFPRLGMLGELPGVWQMAAIMAPAMPLGIANFMFGTAGLNSLEQRGYLLVAILITGAASTVICLALGTLMGATGAALCFVLAEALLLALVLNRYLRPISGLPMMPADRQKGLE